MASNYAAASASPENPLAEDFSNLEVVHVRNESDLEVDRRKDHSDLELVSGPGVVESLQSDNLQPYHPTVPTNRDPAGPIPYHPDVPTNQDPHGLIPYHPRTAGYEDVDGLIPTEGRFSDTPEKDLEHHFALCGIEISLFRRKHQAPRRPSAGQRYICGLSALRFWIVVIVAVVLAAAIIGGAVGGVLSTGDDSTASIPSSSVTSTTWLDAIPTTTTPYTPSLPTGSYTLPLHQTLQIDTCIEDAANLAACDCMNTASMSFQTNNGTQNLPRITFNDSLPDPTQIRYGPQLPQLNNTSFDLAPYLDTNREELGVAMFFSTLFDKYIILPGEELSTSSSKRSVHQGRAASYVGDPLQIGDQPWYCWWNSTVSEVYIYLGQDATVTGTPATPTPSFPKIMKMVEKRKPSSNVKPYCQKMQVLNNWQILPVPNAAVVSIQERGFSGKKRDTATDYRSNCVCEWYNS
ncbi:hypothetical protein CLAIMM_03528 [Cladophialophora immunda]|nr:hypothetical protein CLAIMM_03528 [Cladophialophora immunda]